MIRDALEINKRNALALGILTMPKMQFTLMDLFLSITSLSYKGDIRMKFKAENPNKVKNIVEPNFEHFLDYYEPHINQFEKDGVIQYQDDSVFMINPENSAVQYLTDCIPHDSYLRLWIKENAISMTWEELQHQLGINLEVINQKMSVRGIMSGLYSTNPVKNMIYALNKKRKSRA